MALLTYIYVGPQDEFDAPVDSDYNNLQTSVNTSIHMSADAHPRIVGTHTFRPMMRSTFQHGFDNRHSPVHLSRREHRRFQIS